MAEEIGLRRTFSSSAQLGHSRPPPAQEAHFFCSFGGPPADMARPNKPCDRLTVAAPRSASSSYLSPGGPTTNFGCTSGEAEGLVFGAKVLIRASFKALHLGRGFGPRPAPLCPYGYKFIDHVHSCCLGASECLLLRQYSRRGLGSWNPSGVTEFPSAVGDGRRGNSCVATGRRRSDLPAVLVSILLLRRM